MWVQNYIVTYSLTALEADNVCHQRMLPLSYHLRARTIIHKKDLLPQRVVLPFPISTDCAIESLDHGLGTPLLFVLKATN